MSWEEGDHVLAEGASGFARLAAKKAAAGEITLKDAKGSNLAWEHSLQQNNPEYVETLAKIIDATPALREQAQNLLDKHKNSAVEPVGTHAQKLASSRSGGVESASHTSTGTLKERIHIGGSATVRKM